MKRSQPYKSLCLQEALTAADQPLPSVKVHPLVITSILNSYMRRIEKEGRIVGMLLGVVRDGVVEVSAPLLFISFRVISFISFFISLSLSGRR